MHVKWTNVIVLGMAIFALVMMFNMPEPLKAVLASIRDIGTGHTLEEKTVGLCVLGVILITIVALAKILTRDNRRDV